LASTNIHGFNAVAVVVVACAASTRATVQGMAGMLVPVETWGVVSGCRKAGWKVPLHGFGDCLGVVDSGSFHSWGAWSVVAELIARVVLGGHSFVVQAVGLFGGGGGKGRISSLDLVRV
jgi:hypothetical protein